MVGVLRASFITINNPEGSVLESVKTLNYRYMLVVEETAPTTGTVHWHVYVQFVKQIRWNSIKKILPMANIEPCKGTPEQNRDYLLKGEQDKDEWEVCGVNGPNYGKNAKIVFEDGEVKTAKDGGDAEKQRWRDMIAVAKEGDWERFEHEWPEEYAKHYEKWMRIHADNMSKPKDLDSIENWWIWGATGVGKSRGARIVWPDYFNKPKNKWWDGYTGQETVIIEEVGPKDRDWITDKLKVWSDHYSFVAENKGKSRTIRPGRIVVTSNYSMEEVFGMDVDGELEPLKRRFKQLRVQGFNLEKAEFEEYKVDVMEYLGPAKRKRDEALERLSK